MDQSIPDSPPAGEPLPVIPITAGEPAPVLDYRNGPVPKGVIVEEFEPGRWRIVEKKAMWFRRSLNYLINFAMFVWIAVILCEKLPGSTTLYLLIPLTVVVKYGILIVRYSLSCRKPQEVIVDDRGLAILTVGPFLRSNRLDLMMDGIFDVKTIMVGSVIRKTMRLVIRYDSRLVALFPGRSRTDLLYIASLISTVLQNHGWKPQLADKPNKAR